MPQIVKRLSEGSETWNLDGTCDSAEIPFFIINPDSKSAAISAAQTAAPSTYGNLPLAKLRFDGFDNDGNITVIAVYEKQDSGDGGYDETDEPTVNFDCSTGTLHVTEPISQVCVYSADGPAESAAEAAAIPIGWNGKFGSESEAAGVDISTGELKETYTKVLSRSTVTGDAWKRKIADLVGKVNSSSFKGWQPGEVMFLGASYSAPLKGVTKVQVSFHFAIHLNESNVKVSGQTISSCDGYEYLWAISSDKAESGKLTKKVKKIYKAVVCQSASFSTLGL